MFKTNTILRALIAGGVMTSVAACGGSEGGSGPSGSDKENPTDEQANPETQPPTNQPSDESYRAVTSFVVNSEARFPTNSDDVVMGPFTGLSASGRALALWESSDFDILGTGKWISTLHYVSGDAGSKAWLGEQSLPLNANVESISMSMAANGNAVVIYTTMSTINALHFNPDSGLLSSPIQLKTISSAQIKALEVNARGDALAVWVEQKSGDVVARFYDAENQSWMNDETVLNRTLKNEQFKSEGFIAASINNVGQAFFADSAHKADDAENVLVTRAFDGTSWSNLSEHDNPLSPLKNNIADISSNLTNDGRLVVAVGRSNPGLVRVASGTINNGIGTFEEALYEYGADKLSHLDARWTGNNQITATYVVTDNSKDQHFFSRSEDSGQNWLSGSNYETVSIADRSVASNASNTIYIQDGSQCERKEGGFGAPLFAINHNGKIVGTCSINRMSDVSLAVNDAGYGIVAGEHDAIDAVILHFFESGY